MIYESIISVLQIVENVTKGSLNVLNKIPWESVKGLGGEKLLHCTPRAFNTTQMMGSVQKDGIFPTSRSQAQGASGIAMGNLASLPFSQPLGEALQCTVHPSYKNSMQILIG